MIRTTRCAVLFDIGGPIDLETESERQIDTDLRVALAAEGVAVDDTAYAAAGRHAVESFAPNAYQAMLWTLCCGDRQRAERAWGRVLAARAGRPRLFQLRPGIDRLLADLAGRGIRLGLAANQPAAVLTDLQAAGIAGLFGDLTVSDTIGLRKPDPRLFLHACAALSVDPVDCIMVGDRIDNDIAPARLLGMAAIRFRTGRHAGQRPRSWHELPDAEVEDVAGLARAIDRLVDGN
ncbi:HAD family hydrolase [Inquilinus limosus]|uniref:HAD family hydrolase n=1 Tax=Inquilinus limosus TaxID=171674 RepID=UPI003F142EEA